MSLDMTLVNQAEQRGYLIFNEDHTKVTYRCGRIYSDDYTNPEEKVRAAIYGWLIIEKGYPANRIEVEVPVPRRTPGDRANIVVFFDDARDDPYLVVEVAANSVSTTE
ncbi:MAG: hypothetical protein DLM72_12825 [Candidatus Nitrosopolaris wilkensis]|nr:MAG: hypothetical protein DLM72_12825 [Candidatus Nitrosopolaris wilkensis]